MQSSSIASVGYDRRLAVLEVEFRNGRVYRYLHVPTAVFERLLHAPSKGRYLNRFVRSSFEFERA